jgi:hypothetical protein
VKPRLSSVGIVSGSDRTGAAEYGGSLFGEVLAVSEVVISSAARCVSNQNWASSANNGGLGCGREKQAKAQIEKDVADYTDAESKAATGKLAGRRLAIERPPVRNRRP